MYISEEVLAAEYKKFCIEMMRWHEGGCQEHRAFKTAYGLCDNLYYWKMCSDAEAVGYIRKLHFYQKALFERANLSPIAPFNESSEFFWEESERGLLYANLKRVQWVRDHAS